MGFLEQVWHRRNLLHLLGYFRFGRKLMPGTCGPSLIVYIANFCKCKATHVYIKGADPRVSVNKRVKKWVKVLLPFKRKESEEMNFLKNIADKAKSATESPTRTNAIRNSSTGNFKTSVIQIRDILVRIRIHPYLWLTDPGCGSGRSKKHVDPEHRYV
jgi:hypothetical protein